MSNLNYHLYSLVINDEERDLIIDGLTLLAEDYRNSARQTAYEHDADVYRKLEDQADALQDRIFNNRPLDIKEILNNVFNDKEESNDN